MKISPVLITLLILSCNSKDNRIIHVEADSSKPADTNYMAQSAPDSTFEKINADRYYIWQVNALKKTLKKNPGIKNTGPNVDSIIKGLNMEYENIFLERTGMSHDSLYLIIKNSDYLANQMGTGGPDQYISQTVINLTSVPGIKFVHLDLKEGSHAGPGTWSRKDFPGYIIIH
ncbi:MAG: hypothetical protein ABIO04_04160 [Ferruginibacter sp.]